MSSIGLFWWAPRRSIRLLRPEARPNGRAWARLALRSGRPLLNFGDELSRQVVHELTGSKVRWSQPQRADLVAIGSVFELAARAPSTISVWGTGVRIAPSEQEVRTLTANVGEILAVRGPRTRDALGLPADLPIGDPGLLVYRHATRAAQPRGTVLIPHFTQWNTVAGRQQIAYAVRSGLTVVDPSQSPRRVVAAIAAARLVVSASLHGVVVAHGLGVPVELIRDDRTREPLWKYDDYFSSLSLPVEWSSWEDLRSVRHLAELRDRRTDQAPAVAGSAEGLGEGLSAALRTWVARRAERLDPATASTAA